MMTVMTVLRLERVLRESVESGGTIYLVGDYVINGLIRDASFTLCPGPLVPFFPDAFHSNPTSNTCYVHSLPWTFNHLAAHIEHISLPSCLPSGTGCLWAQGHHGLEGPRESRRGPRVPFTKPQSARPGTQGYLVRDN